LIRVAQGYQVTEKGTVRNAFKFPDLNHAVKRDPRINQRSPKNN
jgi:catalase